MSRIMLGDHIIDSDKITLISERNVELPVKISDGGFFTSPEYRNYKFTCVVIKVSEGTVYYPTPQFDDDTMVLGGPIPVGPQEEYEYYTIYNDEDMLTCAMKVFVQLAKFSPERSYGKVEEKMVDGLEALGMKMVFGRRWKNPHYLDRKMIYDQDIKSKLDFIEKYLT